jgi:hypothetical protein
MSDPVIAELPCTSAPGGRSRLAVFLDGDTTNTAQANVIDEGYFDNCYSYEDDLEDIAYRCTLQDRVAMLEEALVRRDSGMPIASSGA